MIRELTKPSDVIDDINNLLIKRGLNGNEKMKSPISGHIATAQEWAQNSVLCWKDIGDHKPSELFDMLELVDE